jgi:hypothetical protein
MGSSFVKLKTKGFWARDRNLEDWLLCLVDEIDRSGAAANTWLWSVREHWYIQATAGFHGCIDAQLDESIGDNDQRRSELLGIAESARLKLAAGSLSPAANPGGPARVDDSVREYVLSVADLFLKLLRGELQTDASSPRDYMRVKFPPSDG